MVNNDKKPDEILDAAQLNELRRLLFGLDNLELARLQRMMKDPHEFAAEIRELLPHAVRQMIDKGEITTASIGPFIEDAIQQSIRKNPRNLADILFPIMGPAIRKAVAEDLKKMVASINASLEAGLSPKMMKWRLQALFSKRSFAEIVLAKTYIYHVSHVFLIHRETGILLNEERAPAAAKLEADMISGMLTAIRDFARDSFREKGEGSLEVVQVGELNIIIEQGPYAIVAAVVEGQAPLTYRETLAETIEAIHFNHLSELKQFDGDISNFVHTSRFLVNCLEKQRKKEKKARPPWLFIVLIIILSGLIAWLLYLRYENNRKFNDFVTELENTPGYHITHAKRFFNQYTLSGLYDFQAKDINEVVVGHGFEAKKLSLDFKPFISLHPELVVQRAKNLLQAPDEVSMAYDGRGTLILKGSATAEWLEMAYANYEKITGVVALDAAFFNTGETPSFEQINDRNLSWIIPIIENFTFAFEVNVVKLDALQKQQFDSLISAAIFLSEYNGLYNSKKAIQITTYTSRSGNAEANLQVAGNRAAEFVDLFRKAGMPEDLVLKKIVFVEDVNDRAAIRSVSFKIIEVDNGLD